jgi:hypothetical protein
MKPYIKKKYTGFLGRLERLYGTCRFEERLGELEREGLVRLVRGGIHLTKEGTKYLEDYSIDELFKAKKENGAHD